MSALKKVFVEIKIIARTSSYFAIVFIFMTIVKKLYLRDYDIDFMGISQALIGAASIFVYNAFFLTQPMLGKNSFVKIYLHIPLAQIDRASLNEGFLSFKNA